MNTYLEIASNGKKIPMVDYLKGFSIATIVLMHLLSLMSSIPSKIITLSAIGGTGVHVFFLCSGIGLSLSQLNRSIGYRAFLKKRFFKIYIPYILIVILSFFLPWMYSGSDRITALFSHIFLFKMFVPRYEESFGVQFWYISTLFQLYALFIPMHCLKDRLHNNKLFLFLSAGISVIWWIFCYYTGIDQIRIWGSFCFQYLWEFALGFVLAEAFYLGKTYRIKTSLLLLAAVAGISLQAGLALFSDTLKIFNDIPALIGYTSLALFFSSIPFFKTLCNKLSAFSYELFLIHMLIFETVFYLANPHGLVMEFLLGCLCIIIAIVAAVCYRQAMYKLNH